MESPDLSPRERAAVLWAEHVTRNTAMEREDVFEEVSKHFSNAELVELTGIISFFNRANRVQDTLKFRLELPDEINKIKSSVRVNTDKLREYLEMLVETWPTEFPVPCPDIPTRRTDKSSKGRKRRFDEILLPGEAERLVAMGPRVPLIDLQEKDSAKNFYLRAAGDFLDGATNSARVWAHIPHVAKVMLPFQVAIMNEGLGGVLSCRLKQMAAIKTSYINRSVYCLAQCTDLSRSLEISDDEVLAISSEDYMKSPLLSARERAAVLWAEHIALNTARARDDVFELIQTEFSSPEVMELTGVCAVYNMWNRFHRSLRIPVEGAEFEDRGRVSVRMNPVRLQEYLRKVVDTWPSEFPVPDAQAPVQDGQ